MDNLPMIFLPDTYRHLEQWFICLPSIGNCAVGAAEFQFQGRDCGVAEVLIEDRSHVHAGLLVEELQEILGHNVLILEMLVELVQEFPPAGIIVNDAPQSVDEEYAFEVLVGRRLTIYAARREDRPFILDLRFVAVQILNGIILAIYST